MPLYFVISRFSVAISTVLLWTTATWARKMDCDIEISWFFVFAPAFGLYILGALHGMWLYTQQTKTLDAVARLSVSDPRRISVADGEMQRRRSLFMTMAVLMGMLFVMIFLAQLSMHLQEIELEREKADIPCGAVVIVNGEDGGGGGDGGSSSGGGDRVFKILKGESSMAWTCWPLFLIEVIMLLLALKSAIAGDPSAWLWGLTLKDMACGIEQLRAQPGDDMQVLGLSDRVAELPIGGGPGAPSAQVPLLPTHADPADSDSSSGADLDQL